MILFDTKVALAPWSRLVSISSICVSSQSYVQSLETQELIYYVTTEYVFIKISSSQQTLCDKWYSLPKICPQLNNDITLYDMILYPISSKTSWSYELLQCIKYLVIIVFMLNFGINFQRYHQAYFKYVYIIAQKSSYCIFQNEACML